MIDDLYHFVREALADRENERVPHRASLISDAIFCRQYAQSAHASDFRVIHAFLIEMALCGLPHQGEGLDVACGPGVLLTELARRRPDFSFIGLDLSPAMLSIAQRHLQCDNVRNVQLVSGDMGRLADALGDRKFDWIGCTFGLHYCRTAEEAHATLDALADLLKPGGSYFIADLARFKRAETSRWFAEKYDRDHGDLFYEEIRNSYRASFSHDELRDLLRQSRLPRGMVEWSRLFPVLFAAHNHVRGRVRPVRIDLPWSQRLKLAVLRTVFNRSAVRSVL